MRSRVCPTAVLLGLAFSALSGCADTVGLAHGDPGHAPQQSPRAPLLAPVAPDAPAATAANPANPATPATPATPAVTAQRAQVFGAVLVRLTDQAQQLAASDARLDAGAVAAAVEQELRAHQLLSPGAAGLPTLVITVEDFSTALASNAMVLGYTFRNAVLIGSVGIQGTPAPAAPFEVHARARLTTRQAGAHAGSIALLYDRFAQLVVADLRGVAAPEDPMPR